MDGRLDSSSSSSSSSSSTNVNNDNAKLPLCLIKYHVIKAYGGE
jgi:hypothetical protein